MTLFYHVIGVCRNKTKDLQSFKMSLLCIVQGQLIRDVTDRNMQHKTDNVVDIKRLSEDVEYYICGPPMMNQAVFGMLDDLGVEPENIRFDDFGG